jgi:carboxylesterase
MSIQGRFLSLLNLLRTRPRSGELPPPEWMGVQGPEHETFLWPGGQPAALLIHGFPDTPASLQPLGRVLREAGWTVQGLLLPGFGPQIETLPAHRWEEWHAAILAALTGLRREHAPVLLVGYSLGGALCLGAAAESPPDGLALLAPFIWPWPWWQAALARRIGPFLVPRVRPFKLVNFDDPRIRAGVAGLFPHADLSDPATLERVRRLTIPFALFSQVRGASQDGYQQAARVEIPVLIVQGRHDNVALPRRTRLLLPRLREARYVEVDADHEVLSPTIPAWAGIRNTVLEFANSLIR